MRRLIYILFLLSTNYVLYSQCSANFIVSGDGNNYQFTETSITEVDDSISSRLWRFGDNNTSIQKNPAHSYTSAGLYDVILEISTANGCNDSIVKQVEVCEIDLDFNLSSVCDTDGNVSLIVSINDVFNTLEEVDVFLDDLPVSDSSFVINSGQINVSIFVPGDGNQHFVRVQSLPNGFCSQTIGFLVQDCNSSCFLSGLMIDEGYQETHTIAILEDQYVPNNRVTNLGDRVRFVWFDDGHTSTSVDTISSDQWDSGVQDSSYTLDLFFKNPGIKPYFSETDGGSSGSFTGNIIANCPESRGSILGISFLNAALPSEGFYLGVDGVVLKDTVYQYNELGLTSVEFFLPGDGNTHQISVVDIQDPSCSIKGTVRAINCQGDFNCALNVNSDILVRCNADSLVTLAVNVSSLQPSDQGVRIIVDDTLSIDTIFFINDLATAEFTLFGDGLIHKIEAVDLQDTFCRDETFIRVNDCQASCSIEDLEIGTGSNNTIVLGIIDNTISLENLTISSGDDILWQWFQDSLVGVASIESSGPNSWDSGLLQNGGVFVSPVLTAGMHPYFLYNSNGDTLFNSNIEVIASCEDNRIPVFYQFFDINGSEFGYDIFIDDERLEDGPFNYTLDGNNRGVFQIEGDDAEHLIEIRDLGVDSCSADAIFIAPSCEQIPCGGMIELQIQDSCYNDNTIRYVAKVSHPEPSDQGFIFSLNGNVFEGFPFFYDGNGSAFFDGFLPADSSEYIFTYIDLLDTECTDTLIYQSDICVTDCALKFLNSYVLDSSYLLTFPDTPDSLIGCQDSFINVQIRFSETYSDADSFFVYLDSVLIEGSYFYNFGDTINDFILPILGDEEEHTIQVVDAVDSTCRFSTVVATPLCFSPCNIEIIEITTDSCIDEVAYYSLHLNSNTNSIGFQSFYNGDSILSITDSLTVNFSAGADGLMQEIKLVDNLEPLCRDSLAFTAAYCLSCPLSVSLTQRDSCEIEDSIGYSLIFQEEIDTIDVFIEVGDSSFLYNPSQNNYEYNFRLRGDSSSVIYYITSAGDIFCRDTILVQTIDCTPIICAPDFSIDIEGFTITFTDSSTTSEPIIDQAWSINGLIEIGNLNTFNFTVDSIGAYEVCHTITTDSCGGEICKTILVGDPCTLITPFFSVEQITNGHQFTNLSTGMIDEYLYNFGDGIFSNSTDPFHVYQEPGMYEACLIVRQEEFDCQLEYCETIDVISSTENSLFNNKIEVYPNPLFGSNRELNILYDGPLTISLKSIHLYDLSGREIELNKLNRLNKGHYTIEVGKIVSAGIYHLNIQIGKNLKSSRIIIMN